jgi:hypothetical protein
VEFKAKAADLEARKALNDYNAKEGAAKDRAIADELEKRKQELERRIHELTRR